MKRQNILLAILLAVPQLLFAQNFADGFRLSNHQVQGTARSAGMGNAFGALGGDFSSISINPAGSAINRHNEFVITPGFTFDNVDFSINNRTYSDNDQSFQLNNIGAIGVFNTTKSEAGIVSFNYAIGYNRLANYSSNAFANYNQSSVSYLDNLTQYANQEQLSNAYLQQDMGAVEYRDWPTKLAWDTYLIDPAEDGNGNIINGQYKSILYDNELVDQRKSFYQDGYLDEYVFNFSLNFNHKFYLGTTIGIHDVRYEKNTTYEELLEGNNSFRFDDEYLMKGHGFNFKLGAIYKPVQNIRLGLAFHSPTWYSIEEESTLSMQSHLNETHSQYGVNYYNYDFNSPMKVVMSGAVLFGKKGLISVDAEYLNYADMRFRRGGNGTDNFNDLNSEMNNIFDQALNLHIGGEMKLSKQFALRAGYEMYGNPFKVTTNDYTTLSDNISRISAGFGYAVNSFSLNVAYTRTLTDFLEANPQPNYALLPGSQTTQNILMTFGFKF